MSTSIRTDEDAPFRLLLVWIALKLLLLVLLVDAADTVVLYQNY